MLPFSLNIFYYNICIPLFISSLRIVQTVVFNSFNYTHSDKYIKDITQRQLKREKKYLYEAMGIYTSALAFVSFLFPVMFYNHNLTAECFLYTVISHILIAEPLYYWNHRILHIKKAFTTLHYFHHLSYNTIPSTGLVQHCIEHVIYIINFAPSVFIPYFVFNKQNWISICLYFLFHDLCNAIGHSDISYYNSYFTSSYIKYLFYSPEFHKLHHIDFTCNYSLFMPFWDIIFNTYKEPIPKNKNTDTDTIDFVFIVHLCGFSSIIGSPQISIYDIYNKWEIFFNINIDLYLTQKISQCLGFIKYWNMPTYKILQNYTGKVIALNKTPLDYLDNKQNCIINNNIISLVSSYNKERKTKYFGLGNFNKTKSLNDGGVEIANYFNTMKMDTEIKILTGDTMTTAALYHSIISNNINTYFLIGGTGKIGKALTTLLINRKNIIIRLYSSSLQRFNEIKNTIRIELQSNLTLSTDINDIFNYSHVIIGKQLFNKEINIIKQVTKPLKIYDFCVPCFPIIKPNIHHIPIGILENKNSNVLNGFFDIPFGLSQNQIYPCYAGCLLGFIDKRQTNEVGEIDLDEVDYYWELGEKNGFTLLKN